MYLVQILQPCFIEGQLRKPGELVWVYELHAGADVPYRHAMIREGRVWFPNDLKGPEGWSPLPIARFGADKHDETGTAWR